MEGKGAVDIDLLDEFFNLGDTKGTHPQQGNTRCAGDESIFPVDFLSAQVVVGHVSPGVFAEELLYGCGQAVGQTTAGTLRGFAVFGQFRALFTSFVPTSAIFLVANTNHFKLIWINLKKDRD
ncbi:MAG: hypothetical protein WB502_05565 [Thermoactinomyces sp.]